ELNLLVVERRGDAPIAAGGVGVVVQSPAARFAISGDRDAIFGLSARLLRRGVNGTEAMSKIRGIVDGDSQQRFLRLCGWRVGFERMVWPRRIRIGREHMQRMNLVRIRI